MPTHRQDSNDMRNDIKDLLDKKFAAYNHIDFIEQDPMSIPHAFSKKQDIEIAGFFAAIFSWGNRKVIIAKSKELMGIMENEPHDFVLHHSSKDLKRFSKFKHRTFNGEDVIFFMNFLKKHYSKNDSLESAFTKHIPVSENKMEYALNGFYHYFFEDSNAQIFNHTRKHIAAPEKNSTCKRLNMYLRWMVRKDTTGVDFGLWNNIQPADLICPLDVHVIRVANQLKLLHNEKVNWQTACLLTNKLKNFDKTDPVKYDFALFGMGVSEKSTLNNE